MATQTPRSEAARTERIEAALAGSEARKPACCPRCGSREICPMFDDDMLMAYCSDCGRPFPEAD